MERGKSKRQRVHLACVPVQATVEMWERFREEFLALWSGAVKGGHGGDLTHAALFGADAPAGPQALHVSAACFEPSSMPPPVTHVAVRPVCGAGAAQVLLQKGALASHVGLPGVACACISFRDDMKRRGCWAPDAGGPGGLLRRAVPGRSGLCWRGHHPTHPGHRARHRL